MGKFASNGIVFLQISTAFLLFNTTLAAEASDSLWETVSVYDNRLPQQLSTTSSFPVHCKGQCSLLCQRQSSCKGFFYNDVSKDCLPLSLVLSYPNDVIKNGFNSNGFRYYSHRSTCPVATSDTLMHKPSFSCFQVTSDNLKLWMGARDACQDAGGTLAVLDTKDKMDTVMKAMVNNTNFPDIIYHMGCRRPLDKWSSPRPDGVNDFEWTNGQPLDMALAAPYFLPGDPNNGGAQDENVIDLWSNNYLFHWVDIADGSAGYICEFPLI
ncbi:uncharacterized protein [Littorina saxatilis]|uniref:C-type lectin domain-containing protein n=1 Tax=Littorina saxatilis TaxID=31220 RepID=A0AAN9BDW6_9CAEN